MKKNVLNKTLASAVLLGALTLTGCAPKQHAMTPEQAQMVQKLQESYLQKISASSQQPIHTAHNTPAATTAHTQQPATASAIISEHDLAQLIQTARHAHAAVSIEHAHDGLRIDGQHYVDPEGEIIRFASNSTNGDIVYALKTGPRVLKYKYLSASNLTSPVVLGEAHEQNRSIVFYSASGQTISGNNVINTSKGVLVTRDNSAFNYVPGQSIKTISVPEGYQIAAMQKGDLASTGYILLEKLKPVNESLVSLVSSFGSSLGITEANDYKLLNIANGTTVDLDISIEHKDVVTQSNCVRKNSVINTCSNLHAYESVYERNGDRNSGHYFWRVDWMQTSKGPFAVVQEAGLRKLNVINLQTGQRVTVLERTLGINQYDVISHPNGKISINAQLGFSKKHVEDVLARFDQGLAQ